MANNENILGEKVFLFLQNGSTLTPLCCGRSLELNVSKETGEATKKANATWKNFYSKMKSFDLSFDTLSIINTNHKLSDIHNLLNVSDSFFFMCKNVERNLFFGGKIILTNYNIAMNDGEAVVNKCTAIGDGELYAVDQYTKMFMVDGNGNAILDGNGNAVFTLVTSTLIPFIENC